MRPYLVGTLGIAEMSKSYLRTLRSLMHHELENFRANHWVQIDDLFEWSRSILFRASSTALFGSEFPMDCCEDYWTFEANLAKFMTLPKFVISSAVRSRHRLVSRVASAIEQHDGYPTASRLVKERIEMSKSFGYSSAEMAKTELDIMFALQANASPMVYWVLMHLLTDPILSTAFKDIADESDLSDEDLIRISKLPELDCIFKEALRMHSHAPIIRKVMSRTVIPIGNSDDESKKEVVVEAGSYVVIPTPTVHYSELNYPDPYTFDPSRWSEKKSSRTKARQQLVSFGAGSHYFPGRFFARIEIMAFAVFFYKLFEVDDVQSIQMASGWRKGAYAQGTQLPASMVSISIRPRKG